MQFLDSKKHPNLEPQNITKLASPPQMAQLLAEKHKKFFLRFLGLLPQRLEPQDSNKLLLTYCSVGGLCLLKHEFTNAEEIINHVYDHYLPDKTGFRGSQSHEIPDSGYDPATLANTYCGLSILSMLGDDLSKIDREAVMSYVSRCQLPNGSFLGLLDAKGQPFGDGDLRTCYLATAIRKLLGCGCENENGNDIDIGRLEKQILSSIQYDGGLGTWESHAGLTFCGLAALRLIDRLDGHDWRRTLDWLAHRQLSYEFNSANYEFHDEVDHGAHNGRDNKFGDTCYSFWVCGSLSVFDKVEFVGKDAMSNYLLTVTQNEILGGFAKSDADDPDPYHSFLALCALSLVGFEGLRELDPVLVITK